MIRITETVKLLIIINVIIFFGSMVNPTLFNRLFSLYYFQNENFQVWQPITHMFMHGGFMHILFNMIVLYFFGSPLENKWGRNKFLFFYFSAGLGAAFIQMLVHYFEIQFGINLLVDNGIMLKEAINIIQTGSYQTGGIIETLPQEPLYGAVRAFNAYSLGASGATSGLLVAFAVFFPNFIISLMFPPVSMPAKIFVTIIVGVDVLSGITNFSLLTPDGIGHWAHIGGALFGFIMAYYWMKNDKSNLRWD